MITLTNKYKIAKSDRCQGTIQSAQGKQLRKRKSHSGGEGRNSMCKGCGRRESGGYTELQEGWSLQSRERGVEIKLEC